MFTIDLFCINHFTQDYLSNILSVVQSNSITSSDLLPVGFYTVGLRTLDIYNEVFIFR